MIAVGGLVAVAPSPSGKASAATNTPYATPTTYHPLVTNLSIGHACYTASGVGIKLNNLAVGQSASCRVRVRNNELVTVADDVVWRFDPSVTLSVSGATFELGDIGPRGQVLTGAFTVTREEGQSAPRNPKACVSAANFTEKCSASGLN